MTEKVLWAEGVFLGQQHFQQWDKFLQQQQRTLLNHLTSYAWGLLDFSIDKAALTNAQFRLNSCRAIFKNGESITCQSDTLSCEVQGEPGRAIEIYLCLPNNDKASGISGYNQQHNETAWQAEYVTLADEFDQEREREVLVGRPNLILLRGDQSRGHYQSIKIAEVFHQGQKQYLLNDEFIPSVLNLSEPLLQLARTVMASLAAKIRQLQGRFDIQSYLTEIRQQDLVYFLLLQTLSQSFSKLDSLVHAESDHPEQLFKVLLDSLAKLSAHTADVDVFKLPRYEHDNLSGCFHRASRLFTKVLDNLFVSKIQGLSLSPENDNVRSATNIDNNLLQHASFYLAVKHEVDDASWTQQFEKQVKLCARSALDALLSSALPGVRITHTPRPPNQVPVKVGYEYFYCEPRGEFWQQIQQERSLALFLSHEFSQVTLELVTVDKE